MRLAVLSDIHGNQLAFQAVLDDLKKTGPVDRVWVLGDLCLMGPRPVECLQMVRAIPNVHVISGNTDRYLVTMTMPARPTPKDEEAWNKSRQEYRGWSDTLLWTADQLGFADMDYLAKLHYGLEVHVPGYGYTIGYHGSPGNDEYLLMPDTPDEEVLDQFLDAEGWLGFGGHTHYPMDRNLDRWRVVNVGSIGLPRDERRACYVIADITPADANIQFRRVEYDLEAVVGDFRSQNHPAAEMMIGHLNGDW